MGISGNSTGQFTFLFILFFTFLPFQQAFAGVPEKYRPELEALKQAWTANIPETQNYRESDRTTELKNRLEKELSLIGSELELLEATSDADQTLELWMHQWQTTHHQLSLALQNTSPNQNTEAIKKLARNEIALLLAIEKKPIPKTLPVQMWPSRQQAHDQFRENLQETGQRIFNFRIMMAYGFGYFIVGDFIKKKASLFKAPEEAPAEANYYRKFLKDFYSVVQFIALMPLLYTKLAHIPEFAQLGIFFGTPVMIGMALLPALPGLVLNSHLLGQSALRVAKSGRALLRENKTAQKNWKNLVQAIQARIAELKQNQLQACAVLLSENADPQRVRIYSVQAAPTLEDEEFESPVDAAKMTF